MNNNMTDKLNFKSSVTHSGKKKAGLNPAYRPLNENWKHLNLADWFKRAASLLLENPSGTTQRRTKQKRGVDREYVRVWYAKPQATRDTDGSQLLLASLLHAYHVHSHTSFGFFLTDFQEKRETDRNLLKRFSKCTR